MKIVRVALDRVQHALRAPIRASDADLQVRIGIRVRLQEESGMSGIGEALPLVSAGTEAMHEAAEAALDFSKRCEKTRFSLEEFCAELARALPNAPATRAAFDLAAHDLEAHLRACPVAALFDRDYATKVGVNAVLGIAGVEETVAWAERARAHGFRTLKLKLGLDDDADRARVAAVRRVVGPDVRIRVDANGAWTAHRALAQLEALAELDIELVEQPVDETDVRAMVDVHRHSPIPVAVDEALATPEGVRALFTGEIASIAILKPTVLGGLAPAAYIAAEARARHIRTIVTTTFDGPIGTAAALHLAAACGTRGFDHGLASSEVLEGPFPGHLRPDAGALLVEDTPGLGEEAKG